MEKLDYRIIGIGFYMMTSGWLSLVFADDNSLRFLRDLERFLRTMVGVYLIYLGWVI